MNREREPQSNQLFKEAICNRYGGPMNTSGLECSHCGTHFTIDWSQIVPLVTEGIKPKRRDRVVDAVLIAILQREAITAQVEVMLTLDQRKNDYQINVLVKEKKFDNWQTAGRIGCSSKGKDYVITAGEEDFCSDEQVEYLLSWKKSLEGGRVYTVENYEHLLGYPSNYPGENALFNSREMRLVFGLMISKASKWIRWEKEQAAENERIAKLPWLRRKLGLY